MNGRYDYIFHWTKWLGRKLGHYIKNLLWKSSDIGICSKMVANIYYIWGRNVIRFLNHRPDELESSAKNYTVGFHKVWHAWKIDHFSSPHLGFTVIKFFQNFPSLPLTIMKFFPEVYSELLGSVLLFRYWDSWEKLHNK